MNKPNTLEQRCVYLISLFLTVVCSSCWGQRISKNRTQWGCLYLQDAIWVLETGLECYSFFITTVILQFTFSKPLSSFICSLLWEIFTECLTTWWKAFWGFPCHSGTSSERTSEVLIIFHCPDTVSFTYPHTEGHTFMKLMYFYMFSRKMIFGSLPLIFLINGSCRNLLDRHRNE